MAKMARNNQFYKKSFLTKVKDFIKNILSAFALLVLLYYNNAGNLTNALQLYLFEFPLQIAAGILLNIKDLILTIIKGT